MTDATVIIPAQCVICRFSKIKPSVPAHAPGWLYCIDQSQNVSPVSRCDRFEFSKPKKARRDDKANR